MSEPYSGIDHAVAISNLQRRLDKLEDLVRHQNRMIVFLLFATTFLFLAGRHLATIMTEKSFLALLAAGIAYILYAVFIKPSQAGRKTESR